MLLAIASCSVHHPYMMQAQLRDWEAQEAAKKQLHHDIMVKLKHDREEQLAERERRKKLVS